LATSARRILRRVPQFRAVATCYDKRTEIYQGTVDVASIRIWLRGPPHDLQDST
jgi:transposase